MFQVTFSKQCMRALNAMPKSEQLSLVEKISDLSEAMLQKPGGDLGRFQRDGRVFYRLRAEEHRVYFEPAEDSTQLRCHYILHKNTLTDFIFRCKLPINNEQMLEQHKSFWKYLETLSRGS